MIRSYTLLAAVSAIVLASCGNGSGDVSAETRVQSEAANVTSSQTAYELVEIASGFEMPWGIAFLPDGSFLVSEREGFVSYVAPGEKTGNRLTGVPTALVNGQGGVLDIALDPDFEANRNVYLSYSKGSRQENATALFKAVLSEDRTALEDGRDIYWAPSKRGTSLHYGGSLLFLPDGTLLLGLGDGFRYMDEAQNPKNSHGTIVRLNSDGSVPADNPFADGKDGLAEVYSYGHRNVQGLAYDAATDTIYESEHGPMGGDEVNILEPGKNYGWPKITYGVNYNGTIITTETEAPGMEQPIVKWVPSIAPSSIAFYSGDKYPEWKGDILTSALAGSKIQRIDLDKGRVRGEEAFFEGSGQRFRNISQGPNGYLYVLVDDIEGVIYRIEAK